MNEEIIPVGDGIMSQVERAYTNLNISNALEQLIDEVDRITGVPVMEGESNEGSSLSEEIARMGDDERMAALASGNATVEQVLDMDPPELSPLSEEEAQILEQAVEDAHNEIPKNSGSLLVNEATSRFSSAIWYQKIQEKIIVLAGVGGIGSYVGFLLARMKPSALFIFDPDTVETANMSGQLYGRSDIGVPKVSALSRMITTYTDFGSIYAVPERFNADNQGTDIMICGFDNMEARKTFFSKWLEHVNSKPESERGDCLYIDGRLAAEEFQVLCIKGDDTYNIERYKNEFLFSDKDADETICSYKQTTFMANMIASFMVNLFVNFVANQCNPLIERDLPFYTTYSAETMYYKTEA